MTICPVAEQEMIVGIVLDRRSAFGDGERVLLCFEIAVSCLFESVALLLIDIGIVYSFIVVFSDHSTYCLTHERFSASIWGQTISRMVGKDNQKQTMLSLLLSTNEPPSAMVRKQRYFRNVQFLVFLKWDAAVTMSDGYKLMTNPYSRANNLIAQIRSASARHGEERVAALNEQNHFCEAQMPIRV